MSPSSPNESSAHQVGPHFINVELPDTLHLRLNGDVEPEHFQAFYDSMVHLPPTTRVYILRDCRNGGGVTPNTRKRIAQHSNLERVVALVNYGSSFHVRTVMTMLNKAIRLFNRHVPLTVFFDSESEARAWIADNRLRSRSAEHTKNDC